MWKDSPTVVGYYWQVIRRHQPEIVLVDEDLLSSFEESTLEDTKWSGPLRPPQ
jgi:hypothetical protein